MSGIEREHFCTACGHRLREADQYCTQCGTPLLPPVTRRPLFVDEEPAVAVTEQLPSQAAPASGGTAGPEPAATTAPSERRRGRVWPWLLVAVLLLVAGGLGFALGGREERPTDAAGGPGSEQPGVSASGAPPSSGSPEPSTPAEPTPTLQPQDRLQQISRRDRPRVDALVGSWVPQLAAVTPGAGGDDSWAQALESYLELKRAHPRALLVDTGAWPHSYERGGMYAILVPRPGATPEPALRWCQVHRYSQQQDCAAKHIATTGSWEDNFTMGDRA